MTKSFNHRIRESFKLEKALKIITSNHPPTYQVHHYAMSLSTTTIRFRKYFPFVEKVLSKIKACGLPGCVINGERSTIYNSAKNKGMKL